MKIKHIQVGDNDASKPTYHFNFEPDVGRQHLPELVFEGNNINEVWIRTVRECRDNDLWEDYILTNVGRFG